jgi:hypothetical protein
MSEAQAPLAQTRLSVRQAVPTDAPACAASLPAWTDVRNWMSRIRLPEVVAAFHDGVFPEQRVGIACDPAGGFLASPLSRRPRASRRAWRRCGGKVR